MKIHICYIACIIVCAAIIFYMDKRIQKSEREASSYASALVEKEAEIQYRITKEGRLLASKEAAEMHAKEIAKAYPKVVEELKKEFDIKMKDMKAYVRNEFEARGSGQSTITNNFYDSTTKSSYRKLEFNDGYLSFESLIDSTSHAMSTYKYSDTITTVIHHQKKWLFGKEQIFSSSKLNNPNAKVTGTTNILVNNYKDKRWVVSAGISYVPFLPVDKPIEKIQPTVSVGYALFKF